MSYTLPRSKTLEPELTPVEQARIGNNYAKPYARKLFAGRRGHYGEAAKRLFTEEEIMLLISKAYIAGSKAHLDG